MSLTSEAKNDPQMMANGLFPELRGEGVDGIRTVTSPIFIEGEEKVEPRRAPEIGQDTVTVLHELGYPADAIEALRARRRDRLRETLMALDPIERRTRTTRVRSVAARCARARPTRARCSRSCVPRRSRIGLIVACPTPTADSASQGASAAHLLPP